MAYTPTQQELDAAPRIVLYELNMLRKLADLVIRTPEGLERNSHIEAFLVHARNLFVFFCGAPKKDDVLAGHFLSAGTTFQPALPQLDSRCQDINKSLSHLTYSRISSKPSWDDIPVIAAEVEAVFRTFLSKLDAGVRSKWG